jgi:class 3 adenylate cyclase/tetratricopeptide (TPR) repeat protein
VAACPACGTENPDPARFCSTCGAAVAAPTVEEVRKTVTVVFCDLAGSTALGERLDAESVRRIVGRYFDEARAAIERHGGTVEKFIGDAVMSVFGIPRVHEDDALRAVRAAAELRAAVIALGDELERDLGLRLAARIGVATGAVVAGDPSSGEAFVTGDVVNVAARLEQAAGAGEVLISVQTQELVRDAVRVESAGPLELKGKSAPVPAWLLLEVVAGPPPARARDAPFVGRTAELAALHAAVQRAVDSRTCQLCTVVGAPGIGKSRIADELAASLPAENVVLTGRCLPYGRGITYWPMVEIVQQATGGSPIAGLLAEDDNADLIAGRIEGTIGVGEPSGAPEEVFWAYRKLFEALAREQPLIVIVDELQWAEPTLLDLLEYLVTFAADVPILLLGLARPELFEERPSWAAPRRGTAVLSLEPLGDGESAILASALTTTRGLGREGLEQVVATAEGNPFFLEQLLAHREAGSGGKLTIPPTVQALLAARIDALGPDERAVLLRASVAGKTFHRGALADLLPAGARTSLGARLIALVREDLIRADTSQFPGDDGFCFAHTLVYEAAYQAAPKELRAETHERYALWLERQVGDDAIRFEEILGHHLASAHDYQIELGRRDDVLAARAATRLARAGHRALERGDVPAAIGLLERADALSADPGAVPAEALLALGVARVEAGHFDAAVQALAAAASRAGGAGDRTMELRCAVEHLWVRLHAGRAVEAEVRAEVGRMIPLLEELDDDAGLARAWLLDADSAESLADSEAAAERAGACARRAHRARDEEDALFQRMSSALYGERPVTEAIEVCSDLLAEARGPLAEVGTLEILGALKVRAGVVEEGRALYRRADELYRELGMRHREAINWQCWGRSELATGHLEQAETALRTSLRQFTEMGARSFEPIVRAFLAHALCGQGRHAEAATVLEPGGGEGLGECARARVLAATGEIAAAVALARQVALAGPAQPDWLEGRALVLTSLAEVLARAGRTAEETEALQEAYALYERKGIVPATERVRARLDELAGASAS